MIHRDRHGDREKGPTAGAGGSVLTGLIVGPPLSNGSRAEASSTLSASGINSWRCGGAEATGRHVC
jgi:hypothetical protein